MTVLSVSAQALESPAHLAVCLSFALSLSPCDQGSELDKYLNPLDRPSLSFPKVPTSFPVVHVRVELSPSMPELFFGGNEQFINLRRNWNCLNIPLHAV